MEQALPLPGADSVNPLHSRPDLRLFCFPHAGSSASVYARWKKRLPPWIEVRPIELPGHGQRLREPLQRTLSGLVSELAADLQVDVPKPFAFFGHSLGALVAFELAYLLRLKLDVQPLVIFASGAAAPSMRNDERYTHLDSDEDVLAELRRQGGTPDSILRDREMMELALPILRADLQLCGRYRYIQRPPLKCGIHAFGGAEDPDVTRERLAAWRNHTSAGFSLELLPGGHFFIQQNEARLLGSIVARLEEIWAPSEPRDPTIEPIVSA